MSERRPERVLVALDASAFRAIEKGQRVKLRISRRPDCGEVVNR